MEQTPSSSSSQPSSPTMSLLRRLSGAEPPRGFTMAAGSAAANEIALLSRRQSSISESIRSHEHLPEHAQHQAGGHLLPLSENMAPPPRSDTAPFENGYHFPPSKPFAVAFRDGAVDFARFTATPMGFFIVLYGLNVVAWGGMLFLLLCNAAPAMCHPTCNDINSPRRVWIEIDSQILNGLFCVTGFGLAPWRFRDLYFLMQYRLRGSRDALRRLAGWNAGWFRLPGSHNLPTSVGPDAIKEDTPLSALPIPQSKTPTPPLTGVRAPDSAVWKLDFCIWMYVLNTLFQVALAGCMWGLNRHDRPSWVTGFLIGVGMVSAMIAGLLVFFEGKKVKSIEGVPLTAQDEARLAADREAGVPHYNNIKDKKPKESK